MPEYLLLFEITNLKNTLFDVHDISSIRGSSYAALQAPDQLQRFLEEDKTGYGVVEPRFKGGSQGVFRIVSSKSPDDIEDQIKAWWASQAKIEYTDNRHRSAIFPYSNLQCVVAVVDWLDGEGQQQAKLKSEAACKWRQFELPSVILADIAMSEKENMAHGEAIEKKNSPYCEIDLTRPVTNTWPYHRDPGNDEEARIEPLEIKYVSRYIHQRKNYGASLRPKELYRIEIGSDAPVLQRLEDTFFTDGFEQMVALSKTQGADLKDRLPISLSNKIAVMQFDLNDLGKLRQRQKNIDDENDISDQMKRSREKMFEAVLDALCDEKQRKRWIYEYFKDKVLRQCVRFETLVWGSDEMSWVMPAWLAWEFLEVFFRYAEVEFSIGKNKHTHAYSGGVVICDRRMPIRRAVNLADELRESMKKGGLAKDQAAVQMEILESFDIPDNHLSEQRDTLFVRGVNEGESNHLFTFYGNDWSKLTRQINELKSDFPRSQLRNVLEAASAVSKDEGDFIQAADELALKQLKAVLDGGDYKIDGQAITDEDFYGPLAGAGNSLFIALYNLDRLWDYVDPFGDRQVEGDKGEAA